MDAQTQVGRFLNAAGGPITPHVLRVALTASGLCWRMHPAQLGSLEIMAANVSVEFSEREPIELAPNTSYTLFGFPILLDRLANKQTIELCQGSEVLFRIESLGVPTGL